MLCAVTSLACGSSSTDPSPSGPKLPDMLGTWTGTVAISVVDAVTGARTSNVCTGALIVSGQREPGYNFSGTFQTAGGTTAPCAQNGDVSGLVLETPPHATARAASQWAISFDVVVRAGSPPNGCGELLSSSHLSGTVSDDVLTALVTERRTCGSQTVDRTVIVDLVR
jgi:hypothetical protein